MMGNWEIGEFILAPGEVTVRCPYNFSHEITNMKLIIHLQKCQKNYEKECRAAGKKPEYGTCRFNNNHRFYLPEKEHHERTCPDQAKLIEAIRYHESVEFQQSELRRPNAIPPQSETKDKGWGSDEENWEEDSHGYEAAYQPGLKLEKEVILYQPGGMSKSERKRYRMEQRKKYLEPKPAKTLQKEEQEDTLSAAIGGLKLDPKEEPVDDKKGAWSKKVPPPSEPLPSSSSWGNKKEEQVEVKEEDDYYGEDPFS